MKKILCLGLLIISVIANASQLDFLKQFIKQDNLVFDIGAFKGEKTNQYLQLGARVICVEPQITYNDYLQKRFSKEQQEHRVMIEHAAVDVKKGLIILHISSQYPNLSTVTKHWMLGRYKNRLQWDRDVEVRAITLDDLIATYGIPDFCKIDVEGNELNVLLGLSKPMACVSFEYAREYLNHAAQCLEYLKKLGYEKFNCTKEEEDRFMLNTWVSDTELLGFLAHHSDRWISGDIYAYYN